MHDFLDQIEATLGSGIYATALLSTMMVPDACGAVEYPDLKNGVRYRTWFDAFGCSYVTSSITFDGAALWKVRNAMMHETRLGLSEFGFDRVLFTAPNPNNIVMHMNVTIMGSESALNLDLVTFCRDMISGCRAWLQAVAGDPEKAARLDRLIQYREGGLAPHIVGLPLVA